MAVSDGKGAGGALIEAIGNRTALVVAAGVVIPGSIITLVLTIWAITSA
jgi:hypothetical protein